jgi:hypothetical protein
MRADGVVGVTITRHQLMVERENPDYGASGGYSTFRGGYSRYSSYYGRRAGQPAKREDLIVIVHALGTAIQIGNETPSQQSRRLAIEPVRRLDTNRRSAG